jgi:hypothetical protein|nr:MAG TPA: chromosomal replication initiator protein [Caudoviricetes sp.]
MSQSNKQHDNAPSIMLIMRSVAEAAGMTTGDIMAGGRRAGLCHARAAVYKIAASHGYTKEDIMFFLDRNRTVAYNYEANIHGHLLRNAQFKALCDRATELLNKHPHRVDKALQRPQQAPKKPAEQPQQPRISEPVFTDWKGKLGWTFTAEECRREWYAKRAAEEWFNKTYRQAPRIQPRSNEPKPRKVPTEMTTAEATVYLEISAGVLVKGVQLGRLHRFKKPHDTSYWFHTAELDQYKIYLEQNNKRINPKY